MEDRRVQRTRQQLERALLELIEERNYESITVQQITDRANMGRATFYLHYRDKEQLLLATIQRLQEDLARQLEPLRPADFFRERPLLNEQIFRHVERYRQLYEVLLSERGAALARQRLMAYLTRQVEHFLLKPLLAVVGEPAVPTSLLASYVSGTLYTAITWWLEHPQQKTPEEMGQLVRSLTLPAIFAVLGVDPEQLAAQTGQELRRADD
jgi:AcrR family transcriptional regulator